MRQHFRCNLLFGLIGHFGFWKDVNISFFSFLFCILVIFLACHAYYAEYKCHLLGLSYLIFIAINSDELLLCLPSYYLCGPTYKSNSRRERDHSISTHLVSFYFLARKYILVFRHPLSLFLQISSDNECVVINAPQVKGMVLHLKVFEFKRVDYICRQGILFIFYIVFSWWPCTSLCSKNFRLTSTDNYLLDTTVCSIYEAFIVIIDNMDL